MTAADSQTTPQAALDYGLIMNNNKSLEDQQQQLEKLKDFVTTKMTMTANYQPVIIRELLKRGGKATQGELALALLQEDQDVMDYWRRILMRWPYKTLRDKHGIVKYVATTKTFHLLFNLSESDEVKEISELCNVRISNFKKQTIPKKSGIRFKLIEQAKGCCQACGAFGDKENSLDIDHIIPQSKAKNGKVKTELGDIVGVHDERNLQVLCETCNSGKKDQGHFNFKPSEKRITEAVSEIMKRAIELGFDHKEIIDNALKSAASK